MRCAKCGAENLEGRKFCTQCGSPLAAKCPRCGVATQPGEKFCGECGATLGTPPAGTRKSDEPQIRIASTPAPENLEGERKTVTALFADIKGSMELIEDLDPEEARAIVEPALKLMIDAVHHHEGYVAQTTGDGIFALFGAPVAHEDHPQRALLAALRMQAEVKRYAEKLRADKGVNLQVRVGANTGEVVVREIRTGEKHTEYVPMGHSTGVAARLEALAVPGSILISESVRRLVEGYFSLKPLGPARIKGISEPLETYEVTGLGTQRTRLQRAAARGYTKFVGRQREMETIQHAAELAKSGHGQVVAVVAEAGVGKSRLFHEFKATNQFGWMVLEAFSVSHGRATAYLPIIELLHAYFRIAAADDMRTRREKVNGKIVTLDPALEDTRPYLFGLLGLIKGDDPLARMDAQIRRHRTQNAIKRILLRESLNQPLMLVFEDLHQIDDETQAILNLLADSIGTSRVLLLVNYRSEYSHAWGSKTYYTQVRLNPLGKESADEMLNTLLGNDESVAPLKRLIAEKSEGNPLFMEEIYQALIEEGILVRNGAVRITRPLSALKIPTTVQAILAARIDRLPPEEKHLLETVAVIGKDFRLGLVGKVVARPQEELERTLEQLQLSEFIYEQPAAGDIEYRFKHQHTREAAYNSVLVERRKALHERVAQAIEELNAKSLDDHLVDLAHHYERSGNRIKAVDYLTRAGIQIAQRSASLEAMRHFGRALDTLKEMPAGRSRDSRELQLQLVIGSSAFTYQGEGSADVGKALARAVELAVGPEDAPRRVGALCGLGLYHVARSEMRRASEVARDLYEYVREMRNPEYEFQANVLMGHVAVFMGEFRQGEQFMHAAAESDSRVPAAVRGYVRARRGQALWVLGFPDQALALAREAVKLGEDADNRYTYTVMLSWAALTHMFCGELAEAEELLHKSLNLCTERGFTEIRARIVVFMGLVFVLRGQALAGVEQIHRGIELIGSFSRQPRSYGYSLARGLAVAGRPDEALSALIPAIEWTEQSGQELELALMHLLKGRLFEDKSDSKEAENSFRTSIEISRRQSAKSLELRATTSLARLLAKQGRRDEARTMLADIYNWFTEGFDTADLKDAKALLDELGDSP
jgi:class 3 adenylate cyclase/tetratricopeptide (TPR) repeat protein